jgi:hypothetical protein
MQKETKTFFNKGHFRLWKVSVKHHQFKYVVYCFVFYIHKHGLKYISIQKCYLMTLAMKVNNQYNQWHQQVLTTKSILYNFGGMY